MRNKKQRDQRVKERRGIHPVAPQQYARRCGRREKAAAVCVALQEKAQLCIKRFPGRAAGSNNRREDGVKPEPELMEARRGDAGAGQPAPVGRVDEVGVLARNHGRHARWDDLRSRMESRGEDAGQR